MSTSRRLLALLAGCGAAAVIWIEATNGPRATNEPRGRGAVPATAKSSAWRGRSVSAEWTTTTDFAYREDWAQAVVVQPDGKLLVAGSSSEATVDGAHFGLGRYLRDGSLDGTFGARGKVTAPPGGAQDALIQPDGRIVAVGFGGRSDQDAGMGVARYLPDGSPDRSFGGGAGSVNITDIEQWGNDCLHANAVALQRDRKLVLVGSVGCGGEAGGKTVAVARLDASGELDSSFDGDGTQTLGFGHCAFGNDVAVQRDGKIVVAGGDGGCYERKGPFRVARLNPDGTVDRAFGRLGRQKISFPAPMAWVENLGVDGRGRILLVGSAGGKTRSRRYRYMFALARLKPSGALDGTFGRGGIRMGPDLGRNTYASAGAILPGGRVAVVGTMGPELNPRGAWMAVYRSNGQLDRSYGRQGVRRVRFGGRHDTADAIAGYSGDSIVIVGSSQHTATSSDFGVARLPSR